MQIQIPKKFSYLDINEDWEKALNSIYEKKRNVIITGEAGSGKSEFIHLITAIFKENKTQVILIAPTGIAAVNIKGATMHSTFGLGIHPKRPEDFGLYPNVRGVLERVEVIIMDEVSMTTGSHFDAMNLLCQKAKGNTKLFGGITLILSGDYYQLTPIIGSSKEEQAFYTNRYGANPFFFNSECYKKHSSEFSKVKFSKIYRQEDSEFKDILNRIRVGDQTDKDLTYINGNRQPYRRFKAKFNNSICLAPFNNLVDEINQMELSKIEKPEIILSARIIGDINHKHIPAPSRLCLREGCKIMLLTNDPSGRYQNGTLGIFDKMLNNQEIQVIIDENKVVVARYNFEEYRYTLIKGSITKQKKGVFSQYPLKIAYALTPWKAQGLTFNDGYVDFASVSVFAEHLVYVALSRFRDFDKVGLKRSIHHDDIKINPYVLEFMKTFDDGEAEIENIDIFDESNSFDEIPF